MAASIRELDNMAGWEEEWVLYDEKVKKLKENDFTKVMSLMEEYNSAQAKLAKAVEMQKKNLKAFTTSYQRIKKSKDDNDAGE